MSKATAQIRQAIHDGPSDESWARLVAAFDALAPVEVEGMVRLAEKHLPAWPEGIRIAPVDWWARAASGEVVPGYRFARALIAEGNVAAELVASPAARQIAHLELRGASLDDAGAAALAGSERLRQLKTLRIVDAELSHEALLALARGRWPHLEALEVSGSVVPPEALGALVRLARYALTLRRASLSSEAGRRLGEIPAAAQLAALDLADNDLGDAGVAGLAASRHLRHLGQLRLANNGCTGRSAQAIANSTELEELTALDLARNRIGPDGLRWLSGGRLDALVSLGLADDGITPDGLSSFLESASLPSLLELDLSKNPIGDDGARRLAESDLMFRLERISMRNCGLSEAVVGWLRERAPEITIDAD